MTYQEWRQRWPQAAAELEATMVTLPPDSQHFGKSEAWAQQQVRMKIARLGGCGWRNNVGASKAKEVHVCPKCSFKFEVKKPPIRWGLCNDSTQLNEKYKSGDVIACIPEIITPAHVGHKFGRFWSFEIKKPGWQFNPNDPHEVAQASWGGLVQSLGGGATFSTGEVPL